MWEPDHKESWVPKNCCFSMVVLEKTLESPLDSKEIKSVNVKGNQVCMFIGRTFAKAEVPRIWLSDEKSILTGKDPDARKDWGKEEKWVTEDEVVGWHPWFNGNESEQTPGESEGWKPGVLQSKGSHRVGCELVTEQQQKVPTVQNGSP